jgi:hypothetical protein
MDVFRYRAEDKLKKVPENSDRPASESTIFRTTPQSASNFSLIFKESVQPTTSL